MQSNAHKILRELFQGGLSRKTAREIRLWFFRNADRANKEEAFRRIWEEHIQRSEKVDPEVRRQFILLCNRLGIPIPDLAYTKTHRKIAMRRLLGRIAVSAAALVFGIGIFSVYDWLTATPEPALAVRTESSRADQAPRMIQLPCGSQVWLRNDSRIDIMDSQREVILDGEACFSVEPNGEPFIVHSNNVTVRVLGTIFYVNDSKSLNSVTVDLFDGSVELESGGGRLALKKGERFVMDKATLLWGVENMLRNPGYPDWVQAAKLPADGIAFDDILDIISKVYEIKTVNNRPDLAADKYFFTLTDDMDIEDAMNTLRLLNNKFTYRIENNILIID